MNHECLTNYDGWTAAVWNTGHVWPMARTQVQCLYDCGGDAKADETAVTAAVPERL